MELQIRECILDFQKEFCRKFGVVPKVSYSMSSTYVLPDITLKELEGIADRLMYFDRRIRHLEGVKSKKRYRNLVLLRQGIYKLARDKGYTFDEIGNHFGFDHSSVLYGAKNFNKLLSVRDVDTVTIFQKLENAIKNKYGHDGDVQHHL